MKTKPDCVCREMKIGPRGEACWVKKLKNEMGLQKFLGLLSCNAAADEAESISSLLMDGSSYYRLDLESLKGVVDKYNFGTLRKHNL